MLLAFAHRTGLRLVEIAGLLFLFAGVWLVASDLQARWARFRTGVAGIAIAVAGVLLIVAVRWGGVG
jgi:hypothetical protein